MKINSKINVLFVCHGNICRSPMAEFVFRDLVQKRGLGDKFHIESAATSTEEIGNPVHRGTRQKLAEYGISVKGKTARQITKKDYRDYDYILGMDSWNMKNMKRVWGEDAAGKVKLLLDYTSRKGDIADPWYTGNFDETYEDVMEGSEALLSFILKEHKDCHSDN